MELYQLRTFVAVAEEGSITRAGKRIHATQPAVSAHIKALEEELGVRLFDRVPRGVELTQAGAELVQDAIEVLSSAQTLQARAVTLGGEVAGQVGLGLCSDPQFLKVSRLLGLLSERFPKLSLSLIQASSGLILRDIRSKVLDAGFVFFGVPYRDLEAIKLAEPEYAILGAAQWKPLLDRGDAATLSEFTWVMPPSHCPFRGLELDILKRHGISPERTVGSDSEEVIRPLIVEGKALALVRGDEAAELIDAGLAVECTPVGRHPVELNFVYRKGDEQNPSIVALIEIVRRAWGVMELYQLKTFVAVAEEGNLTKAAERIYASQPAVSGHIKALEEELGLPLFVRTPRGMRLTEVGKGLKLKAESVLLAAEDMANPAAGYREELTGSLTIALNTDTGFLRVTELYAAMADAHPKLRLKFVQGNSWSILKDVRDRRIDAGFSFFDNRYAEVAYLRLKEIPVRVVAPAAWSARVQGLPLHGLAALPWVRPNAECPFMKILDGVFEGSGIGITDYIEADSEDVIRELVAAGKGLSLLKQSDADAMVQSGTAVICETGPVLSLNIGFAYPRSREKDPIIRALAEAVRSLWPEAGS